jgi:hypothetical protein
LEIQKMTESEKFQDKSEGISGKLSEKGNSTSVKMKLLLRQLIERSETYHTRKYRE